jgi:hypothetical protein
MTAVRVLALPLLASVLSAQIPTHISPAAAANGLGNINNTLPFQNGNVHYQQVHSAASWSNANPAVATQMSFRMARGGLGYTGPSVDMEIYMAQSPTSAATASNVFANNVSPGTEINVFIRRIISLPNLTDNSWQGVIPFDQPFLFPGNVDLSWRVQIWSNNVSPYVLDCFSDWRNGPSSPFAGCMHPTGTRNALHNATYRSPGNTSDFLGYPWLATPTPGIPALLLIGNSNIDFLGVPLPLDLTPAGAPGCQLVNNILIALATVTGTSTFVQINVLFPPDPSLVNQTYYSQYLFFEPTTNPLGVLATNGRVNRMIPAPVDVTRIYASGNPGGTTGTLGVQFALPVGLN